MYEESGSLDPNAMMGDSFPENVGLSEENLPYPYSCGVENTIITTTVATTMENIANPQQMGVFPMENQYNHSNNTTTKLVEEINNNNNHGSSQNLSFHQHLPYSTPTTPDLLNLLHFPRSPASPYGNSSLPIFENTTHNTTTWPQQPITHAQSHVYAMPPPLRNDFVYGHMDDMEGSGVTFQEGSDGRDFGKVVTDVSRKTGGRRTKHVNTTFNIEKQRRVELSSRFDALRDLIPSPTKSDRASVVGNAIEYIRELLRTVNALKSLLESKRHEKQRMMKRLRVEEGATEGESEDSYNEGLRSSWIQRKSKDTEVDVRIIDDEVTIKLVQRKKINCLVYTSQVVDEFNLVLQHVASGHIGDFCSIFINSKISEGSTLYASAIANKLIEVMDRSSAAA